MASRRTVRRTIALAAAALSAAVALAPGPAHAADPGHPSRLERASYWIERLARGPEETTFAIPSFHLSMLDDAIANLRALPAETLERLADPALRERLTTQQDANPWHAILQVLTTVGKARPDVVRAWAVPALDHALLTLAREALPPLAALRSPEDAPALLRALQRHASDRVLGPGCAQALARLGPPWDGAALAAVFAGGEIDRPSGSSSLWEGTTDEVASAPGGASRATLAWWAILSEASGPLAHEPRPDRAGAAPAATVRLEHALGRGALAAARARAALVAAGAPWSDAVRQDAAAADPEVASIAHAALPPTPEERARALEAARAMANGFARGGPPPDVSEATDLVVRLGTDASAESSEALLRLLETFPPGLGARNVLRAVLDALRGRGADVVAVVARLLRTGGRTQVDRALTLLQSEPDPAYLPLLEAFLDRPETAPRRFEVRRAALFVATAALRRGGLPAEAIARWARHAVEWAFDPDDRSGHGLLGALVDLGPPAEAFLAQGLAGRDRAAYLDLVSRPIGRYLSPDTVAAIVAPVGGDTAVDERRAAISAAFAVAGSDSADVLRALARRLRPADRPDVEFVEKIVRHRAASVD